MYAVMKKLTIALSITLAVVLILILPPTRNKCKSHLDVGPILKKYTNKITTLKLKNGLNLIFNKNTTIPKVSIQLTYHVGSANEKREQFGIAHVIKKLIERSLKNKNNTGAQLCATSHFDTSSYYLETINTNYEFCLKLLATTFNQREFDIQTVLNRTQIDQNDSIQLTTTLINRMRKIVYPSHHPYYHSKYDLEQNSSQYNQEDLMQFYRTYYHPANATLCISGDFKKKELLETINDSFGSLETDQPVKKPYFYPDYENPITQETTLYKNTNKAQLLLFCKIPGTNSKKSYIAKILATMWGTGTTSRLHKILVEQEKVAYAVQCCTTLFHTSGIFSIAVQCNQEKIAPVKQLILQELSRSKIHGFSKAKTTRALQYQQLQVFMSLNSNKWLCSMLTEKLLATHNVYNLFAEIDLYQNLSNITLKNFLHTYFHSTQLNWLHVIPSQQQQRTLSKKIRVPFKQNVTSLTNTNSTISFDIPDIQPVIPDRALTLTNGLTLLLRKRNHLPWFTIGVQLKNAPHLDQTQEKFLGQLAFSLMFNNSKQLDSYGTIYKYNNNQATISGTSMNFEEITHIVHELLISKKLTKKTFNTAKEKVLSTIKKLEQDPLERAHRLFQSHIYQDHEYGWTFKHAHKMLSTLTKKQFIKWLNKNFVGKNLIVSIVGNVTLAYALNIAPELFESLPTGKFTFQRPPKQNRSPITIDKEIPNIQPVVFLGKPSTVNLLNPDYPGLLLLNYICYQSVHAKLAQAVHQELSPTRSTGSWTHNTHKNPGYNFASLQTQTSHLLHAERAMRMMFDTIRHYGITEQELTIAQRQLCAQILDFYENNQTITQLYGYLEIHNLGFNYHYTLLERIKKISVKDMNQICQKYSTIDEFSTIRVGTLPL